MQRSDDLPGTAVQSLYGQLQNFTMNDETIEQEIWAKGIDCPRITPADIEEYRQRALLTAARWSMARLPTVLMLSERPQFGEILTAALDLLTFCVLVLKIASP